MVKTIKELKTEKAITDKEELELTQIEKLITELRKVRLQNG